MTKETQKKLFLFSWAFIFLALLVFGLVFAVAEKGVGSSEAGSWAQAVGTVAAIVGAIWIARDQERYRRDEARVVARISAAGMLHRVTLARKELQVAASWFEKLGAGEVPGIGGFEIFQNRLENMPQWSADELVRLAPLANGCALKMSAALDRVFAGRAMVKIATEDPRTDESEQVRRTYSKQIALMLIEADRAFALAAEQMIVDTAGITQV